MRSPLAYAPDPRRPLSQASAVAATLYLGAPAVACFAFSSPIVLGGAAFAVAIAGLTAGAGRALALAARWSAVLGLAVIVVNALVAQRGATIVVRGWELPLLGRLDVSAEALAEGGVLALRIAVVFAAFAVHTASVDPDRILRLVRPLARHSALTASLIARLVPVAVADHARLREAIALRGPGAAPVSRPALARRLIAGSLDRSVDLAAALELRGYARGAPRSAARQRRSRHGWRFAAAGAAMLAVVLAGLVAGAAGFEPYPTIQLQHDAPTIAVAAALPLLAALPWLGLARLGGSRA